MGFSPLLIGIYFMLSKSMPSDKIFQAAKIKSLSKLRNSGLGQAYFQEWKRIDANAT